jgi:hypothetical protein
MQRPHGEINRLCRVSDQIAQVFLLVNPFGYSLPTRAFTGQAFTQNKQDVHKGLSNKGSEGIFAVVKIEVNRNLGPNFLVRSILFMPKLPRLARNAA